MYKLIIILMLFSSCSYDAFNGKVDTSNHTLQEFQVENYLGTWIEVERIENKFEKGLYNVRAEYYMEKDKIRVLNIGWDPKKDRHKGVDGYIKETSEKGALKVSFFRPFYADYIVLDIVDYEYALVGGGTSEYLWILSKTEEVPDDIRERFIEKAKELGYSYEKLESFRMLNKLSKLEGE